MQKRNSYISVASFFIILSIIFLILWRVGSLSFISGFISKIFSAPRSNGVSLINKSDNLDIVKISKGLNEVKLKKDNEALSDQFATFYPPSSILVPARIIGEPGFIPGISFPVEIILDKGEKDGVKKGQAVVFQNNLVGKVSDTTSFSSKVILINNTSISFTGKLESGVVGVVKGFGNRLEIQNIPTSDSVNKDEVVLTKGDQDINHIGFPPDLIVGKIISVDKDPSALFHKAELKSILDFTKINMVFVVIK